MAQQARHVRLVLCIELGPDDGLALDPTGGSRRASDFSRGRAVSRWRPRVLRHVRLAHGRLTLSDRASGRRRTAVDRHLPPVHPGAGLVWVDSDPPVSLDEIERRHREKRRVGGGPEEVVRNTGEAVTGWWRLSWRITPIGGFPLYSSAFRLVVGTIAGRSATALQGHQ